MAFIIQIHHNHYSRFLLALAAGTEERNPQMKLTDVSPELQNRHSLQPHN